MRKISLFIFGLACLFGCFVRGMDTPIISGGPGSGTNGTFYCMIQGSRLSFNGTENNRRSVNSVAGTLKSLYVELSGAPGGSDSFAFTVMTNGSANASALTCTVSGANVTANDTTHTAAINPGDTVSMRVVASATALNPTNVRFSLLFSGNTANQSPLYGSTGLANLSTTITNYYSLQQSETGSSTLTDAEGIIPTNGTIDNLYTELNGTAGAASSYGFTFFTNGVATTLAATISGAVATTANDTTHSIAVTAGERVTLRIDPSQAVAPTARAGRWSFRFSPTTDGESIVMMSVNASASSTTTQFQFPVGAPNATSFNATENLRQVIGQACTLKNFYVDILTAAGATTKTNLISISKNSSATTLAVPMTNTALTGNDLVHTVSMNAGDELSMKNSPSGTPSGWGSVRTGFVQFISPSAADTDGDFFLLIPH